MLIIALELHMGHFFFFTMITIFKELFDHCEGAFFTTRAFNAEDTRRMSGGHLLFAIKVHVAMAVLQRSIAEG